MEIYGIHQKINYKSYLFASHLRASSVYHWMRSELERIPQSCLDAPYFSNMDNLLTKQQRFSNSF